MYRHSCGHAVGDFDATVHLPCQSRRKVEMEVGRIQRNIHFESVVVDSQYLRLCLIRYHNMTCASRSVESRAGSRAEAAVRKDN